MNPNTQFVASAIISGERHDISTPEGTYIETPATALCQPHLQQAAIETQQFYDRFDATTEHLGTLAQWQSVDFISLIITLNDLSSLSFKAYELVITHPQIYQYLLATGRKPKGPMLPQRNIGELQGTVRIDPHGDLTATTVIGEKSTPALEQVEIVRLNDNTVTNFIAEHGIAKVFDAISLHDYENYM